uniref:Mff-like domain-containing protein n=2 Tax=Strigidae TaxID=30459 RepID=A0A8C0I7H0_BUBBB
ICSGAELLLLILPHKDSCWGLEHLPCEDRLRELGGFRLTAAPLLPLQLMRISGRLRVLEEQCNAWRQKEALVYSVLISACLINTWLWLRR